MKKFFHVFLSALFVSLAAGLASCDKDDNEITEKPGREPSVEYVKLYSAILTEAVFDLYDVKIVLDNGDTKKEIALKKSDCYKQDYEQGGVTYKVYRYDCDGFDGKRGITMAEGFVTVNDNTEALLKAMEADTKITILAGARIDKVPYMSNGDYSEFMLTGIISGISNTPDKLLETNNAGKPFYQRLAETCSTLLGAQ